MRRSVFFSSSSRCHFDLFPSRLFSSPSASFQQLPVPGIKAEPDEQNLRYFKVEIDGPANTPYEGEQKPTNDERRTTTTLMEEKMIAQPLLIFLSLSLLRQNKQKPGGVFKLELFLPEDYPMAAPKVRMRRERQKRKRR